MQAHLAFFFKSKKSVQEAHQNKRGGDKNKTGLGYFKLRARFSLRFSASTCRYKEGLVLE
jgi:hypothetical protein